MPLAAARLAVIAVGGNALTLAGETGDVREELTHALAVARAVASLRADGWGIAITHGNGPQVGLGMRRAAVARAADPSIPGTTLAYCVAESQATLGLVLATAIGEELARQALDETVVTVMTRVLVAADDPAFTAPAKPIDVGARRRLVPSPKPLRLLEGGAVAALVRAGHIVIAGGGGGIPVVRGRDGYRPVDAVVDKDYTSALLAGELDAEILAICTNVPGIAVGFGTSSERWLGEVGEAEARALLEAGEFPPGSMGPKVEAALHFLRTTAREDRRVVVTSCERLLEAVRGTAGTRLLPAPHPALIP